MLLIAASSGIIFGSVLFGLTEIRILIPALLLLWISTTALTVWHKFKKEIYLFVLAVLFVFFNYNFRAESIQYFKLDEAIQNGTRYLQLVTKPRNNFFYKSEFELELKKKNPGPLCHLQEFLMPIKVLAVADASQGLEFGDVVTIAGDQAEFKDLKESRQMYLKKDQVYKELKADLDFVDHKSNWLYKAQKQIQAYYMRSLGVYDGAIISTLLLGSRVSEAPKDFIQKVRSLGLGHFFAASGFHLLVLVLFLTWIFNIFKTPRTAAAALTLIAACIYSGLAGFSPSIIRALVLLVSFLVLRLMDRQAKSLNILLILAALTLLVDPFAIHDIGFQFSYLATAAIIIWASPIKAKLTAYLPLVPNYFIEIISVSIAVQIFLLPLVIYYFDSLQIWTVLANLVFTPLLSLVVVLSFIGFAFALKPLLFVFKFFLDLSQSLPFIDYKIDINITSLVLMTVLVNLIALAWLRDKKEPERAARSMYEFLKQVVYDKYMRLALIAVFSFLLLATNLKPPGVQNVVVDNGRIIFDNCFGPQTKALNALANSKDLTDLNNIEAFSHNDFKALMIRDRSKISQLKDLPEVHLLVLPKLNSKDIYLETLLRITKPQFIVTSMARDSKRAKENLDLLSSYTHTIVNSGKLNFTDKYWSISND